MLLIITVTAPGACCTCCCFFLVPSHIFTLQLIKNIYRPAVQFCARHAFLHLFPLGPGLFLQPVVDPVTDVPFTAPFYSVIMLFLQLVSNLAGVGPPCRLQQQLCH
jgi:hypothetical protein